MEREIVVILDNFRSVFNTASCFRTADGAGVRKIYLTGTTPAPLDRFKKFRKDFTKVALGAEKTVEWEKAENEMELIKKLKENDFVVVAVEQNKKSEDIFEFAKSFNREDSRQVQDANKIALIFGNEVEGISQKVLKKCDKILEIPMRGEKESLNVAVAFAIAVYAIAITKKQILNK